MPSAALGWFRLDHDLFGCRRLVWRFAPLRRRGAFFGAPRRLVFARADIARRELAARFTGPRLLFTRFAGPRFAIAPSRPEGLRYRRFVAATFVRPGFVLAWFAGPRFLFTRFARPRFLFTR